MESLKIHLIQTHTHWHEPERNRTHFDALLKKLRPEGGLVALPEMWSTGFSMACVEQAEEMDGPTVSWMRRRTKQLGCALAGSLIIRDGGRYFNRMIWAEPQGGIETYDKRHVFRMAGEHEHYEAGDARKVVHYRGWRINLAVCYDLRFPVWLRNQSDYDLLLCAANWPAARRQAWATLLRARAIENLGFVAGVNVVGVDGNGVRYCGDSMICGPDGAVLAQEQDRDGVIQARLHKHLLRKHRAEFPAWRDADNFDLRT